MMKRTALIFVLGALVAGSVAAQQPPPLAPLPGPDPVEWWDKKERTPEKLDPLGDRRPGRNAPRVVVANGVDPLLYRLWGLPPLQTMVLRDREVVIEVWSRRPRSARQAIARLIVRRDGGVFIQARAGLGCCTTTIGKRVDIDEKLDVDAAYFRSLARDPVWDQPPEVIAERPDEVAPVCIDGSSYDLTLVEYRRTRHLRRMCHDESVGQVALILSRVLGAAMGKDSRFDIIFPRGVDFVNERSAYEALLADGGKLKPRTGAGPVMPAPEFGPDPDVELAPDEDDEAAADAAAQIAPGAPPAPAAPTDPSILNP